MYINLGLSSSVEGMRWSGKVWFALLADVSQHCVCLSTVFGAGTAVLSKF